ncbi:Hypothetical protein (Fragment) [Durusdinium trenchii]|uniref:Ribosome biogenesis protein NOP53 n=1 Tax=Durusdinium trenchii TaxID=1381693 RepID=A0ABP0IUR9_9DINO
MSHSLSSTDHAYAADAVNSDRFKSALLHEQQEALGGDPRWQPAVSLKRTKPKDDKVPVAKPSLFKQLRQGREAGSAHPELQALEGEEQPSCLKEVTERVGGDPKAGSFLAPESGFPVPLHRAVGKSLGTALKPRRESSDEPEDEEEEIDLENRKMLMNTSPEEAVVGGRGEIDRLVGPRLRGLSTSSEVKEWQQQLLQHLGAETCELLRKRGQRKLKAKMPKTPALKRAEEEAGS